MIASSAGSWVSEWESADPDLIVLCGSEFTNQACRLAKLSSSLNRAGLLLCKAERRVSPDEGVRIEPDLYLQDANSPGELVRSIHKLWLLVQEREAAGVRFFLRAVTATDMRLLTDVRKLLDFILPKLQPDRLEAEKIKYATLEIGLNALEWGNKGDTSKAIYFTFKVAGDKFYVTVLDEGEGFDHQRIQLAADSDEEPLEHLTSRQRLGLRLGGYGILICRRFMDEVVYNARGNEVTMMKRLGEASDVQGEQDS
jgi:anti-sigma regulatory factor (Ser/Thr protein kinase)